MRDDDRRTMAGIPRPRPAADDAMPAPATAPSPPAAVRPEPGHPDAGPAEAATAKTPAKAVGRRRPLRAAVATAGVVALLSCAAAVVSGGGDEAATASASAPPAPAAVPSAAATPWAAAMLTLRQQAGALLGGDEAGWLAAVDARQPALVRRYRGLFRSLRTLGVTRYQYLPGTSTPDRKDPAAFTFPARVEYCFGADTCGDSYPATTGVSLTMAAVGGRMVITAAGPPAKGEAEPVPWQDGTLRLVRGRRVIVAAEASQAKHLATVLPIAERAAAANEPFAAMLHAEQESYRVYLAGEKQWRKWSGGRDGNWVVGLAIPVSQSGYDVVIRISRLRSPVDVRDILRHEFGHVITLTGAESYRTRRRWLEEGVAEYIGRQPKPAAGSPRIASVRWQVARQRPTSMIPAAPRPGDPDRASDAYYGLSHLAVDCLARKFGQARMLRFVSLVVQDDKTYAAAATAAFGQPFGKVDAACAAWIRRRAA
jgi:hypothetical protein